MESKFKKSVLIVSTGILALMGAFSIPSVHAKDAGQYPADNTGKNLRDRDDRTLTPENQPAKGTDQDITQRVRQLLQKDDSLSINAKNVKIITVGSKVTLRGPVSSQLEADAVCDKARQVAGVENVDNQLEVVRKK